MKYFYQLAMLGILLAGNFNAAATVYYVNAAKPDNSGNGTSWSTAKKDLQEAISLTVSGDSIWVKAGAYFPTKDHDGSLTPANPRMKTFLLKSGIKLFGGFNGTETLFSQRSYSANISKLSGDIGTVGVSTDNSYNVLLSRISGALPGVQIDGFTISEGMANVNTNRGAAFNNAFPFYGAGLMAYGGQNNIVQNNVFTNNHAIISSLGNGGGAFLGGGEFICRNNIFINNSASFNGGALYLNVVYSPVSVCQNNIFQNNSTTDTLTNGGGGALYVRGSRLPISNNVFIGNSSGSKGGALGLEGGDGPYNITNNLFYQNSYNGSMTTPYADIANPSSGFYILTLNCKNNLFQLPEASYPLNNTNGGNGIGLTPTNNLFNLNPNLINLADLKGPDNQYFTGDDGFNLSSTSPCRNTGLANTNVSSADILYNPRVCAPDIGAYEYQIPVTYAITAIAGSNGSISPSGITDICPGNNQTYTITPANNYAISNVLVDGVSAGTSGTYTFSNVTANHTISASFYLLCSNSFNTITEAICPGSSYTFFGNTYTAAGVYTHTMVNGNATGCDSIVTLNLTVKANTTSSTNLTICSHQLPYAWNGLTFTVAATQTAHLTNSVGCDSAATLNLSVTPSTTVGTNSVTACISYTWNGNTYTNSGTYIHLVSGCDITVLHLTITHEIVLQARALLQGAYDPNTGMMHDSLRTKGLIPTMEPYTASPYLKPGILEFSGELENTPMTTTGPDAIVDWVFLELRDATDPSIIHSTRRALIQRDGDIVSHEDGVSPVRFYQTPPGTYYVGLKHRNHLGVMSAGALSFPYCTPVVLDFSNPATPVYVKPAITTNPPRSVTGSVALLWAGDANYNKNTKHNGISNDRSTVLDAIGGLSMINVIINNVYRVEDCNLNGKIAYNGTDNDRSVILSAVGVSTPNNVRNQHTID